MKSTVAILLGLSAGSALFAAEAPKDVPMPFPLERYQAMIDKSPFAPATPPVVAAPAAEPTASFAQDFYITGIANMGTEYFVTIGSRSDPTQRISMVPGESHDGIELASVKWVDGVGKSKATLKKGSEFGEIGFDEAAAGPGNGEGGVAPVIAQGMPPTMPGAKPFVPGARPFVPPPRTNNLPRRQIVTPPQQQIPQSRPFVPGQANQPVRPGFPNQVYQGRNRSHIIQSAPRTQ